MRLAFVISRSPSLCGVCKTCRGAGDVFRRLQEYSANRDVGEAETTESAIRWLTEGYSKCPAPGTTSREEMLSAAKPGVSSKDRW